jgi:YVTN family beta-propeller protein
VVALVGMLGWRHTSGGPVLTTVAVGRLPWRVVVDEQSRRAFVINRGDGTVSVLDSATGTLLRTLAVGDDPVAAAVDERTGRVFVANGGDGTVSVLDAYGDAVLATVPVGTDPQWLAVDERTARVFVPNRSDNTVSVLDARNGAVLRTVPVSLFPFAAAVDEWTDRVFVRCNSGRVVVLDARSGAVLRTTPVGRAPWGQVAVDQRTARVFITNPHDQKVSVLDACDGRVLRTVAVGTEGYSLAVDARSALIVVAGPDNARGRVGVLGARSGVLLRTIAVGYAPWPTAVATRTGSVLVGIVGKTDSMGDTTDNGAVSVLDAPRGAVRQTIATGIFPIALAVDNRTNRVFVVNYTARWSDGGPITPTAPKEWWAPLQRWLAGRLAVVPSPRQPASLTHGSVTVLDGSRL